MEMTRSIRSIKNWEWAVSIDIRDAVGIDHVFASGAVVGRNTTHEWGCPLLRAQRGARRPHECVVVCPTTAPDAKIVVNFNSTMIMEVVAIKSRSFWSRIICNEIGITSFKSTRPSAESRSLCTWDDVTMEDECKQSTTTSSTQVKKNSQVNTFHDGLKACMDLCCHCVCLGSYLKYVFSIYKAKYNNRIGESLRWSWRNLICIITRGLCSYNAQLFNEDVTAIEVSYRLGKEFPNYAWLHRASG